MKALPLLVLALALAAAGCGVDTHFHVAQEGEVNLRLGPVGPSCSLASVATGVPYSDGSVVTFIHHVSAGVCIISATWTGPVMDTAAIAAEALGEIHGATIADTRITGLKYTLRSERLRDLGNDNELIDVPGNAVREIHAVVRVDNDRAMAADYGGAGDPEHPDEFAAAADALVAHANDAWPTGQDLIGDGDAELQIDIDGIDALVLADNPAFVLRYKIEVDGE